MSGAFSSPAACMASIERVSPGANGRMQPVIELAALLDYNDGSGSAAEHLREQCMLCAPLVTRDGLVGVVKVAARYSRASDRV